MKLTDLSVDSFFALLIVACALANVIVIFLSWFFKSLDKVTDESIDKHRDKELRKTLDDYFKNKDVSKGADEDEK